MWLISSVQLPKKRNKKTDFSIARMGLDDCDEAFDDIEGRVQLDPRVWARTSEHPAPSGRYYLTIVFSECSNNPRSRLFAFYLCKGSVWTRDKPEDLFNNRQFNGAPFNMPNMLNLPGTSNMNDQLTLFQQHQQQLQQQQQQQHHQLQQHLSNGLSRL